MATKFIAPYRLFIEKTIIFWHILHKNRYLVWKTKIYNTDEKKLWVATLIYLWTELFVFSRLKVKKNTYKNMWKLYFASRRCYFLFLYLLN